jgi:hypothetical protein
MTDDELMLVAARNVELDFNSVYLDTEVLRSQHWPQISAKLKSLFKYAKLLNFQVVIPLAVEMECEQQWLTNFTLHTTEMRKAHREIKRMASAAGIDFPELSVPAIEEIRSAYRTTVESHRREYSIQSIAFAELTLAELFSLAILRKPPFADTAKGLVGFQDTVILQSVIDDIIRNQSITAVFVSKDDIFGSMSVERLRHVAGIDGLIKYLDTKYQTAQQEKLREWYEVEQSKATEALKQQVDKMKNFINEEVSSTTVMAASKEHVHDIIGLKLIRVIDVRPQPLHERDKDKAVRLSATVMVLYDALTHPTPRSIEERISAAIKADRLPRTHGSFILDQSVVLVEMQVEAESRANGSYDNLVFISVSVTPDQ